VGVTVVENALRVHLFVLRRAREDALPARRTSGFLMDVVAVGGII